MLICGLLLLDFEFTNVMRSNYRIVDINIVLINFNFAN